MKTHFILYVADQARSTAFYSAVLGAEPVLDIPGMTEFALSESTILGLMPEAVFERCLATVFPTHRVPMALRERSSTCS